MLYRCIKLVYRTFLEGVYLFTCCSFILLDISGTRLVDFFVHKFETGLSNVPHQVHDAHSHDLAGDLCPIVLVLLGDPIRSIFALSSRHQWLLNNCKAWHVKVTCDWKQVFSRCHHSFVSFQSIVKLNFRIITSQVVFVLCCIKCNT